MTDTHQQELEDLRHKILAGEDMTTPENTEKLRAHIALLIGDRTNKLVPEKKTRKATKVDPSELEAE